MTDDCSDPGHDALNCLECTTHRLNMAETIRESVLRERFANMVNKYLEDSKNAQQLLREFVEQYEREKAR